MRIVVALNTHPFLRWGWQQFEVRCMPRLHQPKIALIECENAGDVQPFGNSDNTRIDKIKPRVVVLIQNFCRAN
jgi:hypothetical protein